MSFLTKEGLAYFWNHIIARLNGKADKSDLVGLATESYVDTKISEIDTTTSWDEIENKPVVVSGSDTIKFSESTDSNDVNFDIINDFALNKSSNIVLTPDDLKNGLSYVWRGAFGADVREFVIPADEINTYMTENSWAHAFDDGEPVIKIVFKAHDTYTPGIYCYYGSGLCEYIYSITITGFTGFNKVEKLDPSYIPDNIATTAYVDTKVADLVESAPETLNTLNELAAALGDDPNFATTVATQIGTKVDKVDGKGLSTNDYTTTEKTKLAGIAEGANKTVVDSALSSTSTNPVQNKVINTAITNLNTLVGNKKVSEQIDAAVEKVKFNRIVLVDTATGRDYAVYMSDGILMSEPFENVVEIRVLTMPDKTSYVDGDRFDPTGMVVNAVYVDGSEKEIIGYTYNEFVDTSDFVIKYKKYGIEYNTVINLTVTAFNPVTVLADFNYTSNGDGTYTLTGWKQTLNKVSSTELIIPDNNHIKL